MTQRKPTKATVPICRECGGEVLLEDPSDYCGMNYYNCLACDIVQEESEIGWGYYEDEAQCCGCGETILPHNKQYCRSCAVADYDAVLERVAKVLAKEHSPCE